MTPEAIERFLREPIVAVLSWLTPQGEVASSPIWYEYRDGKFYLASSSAFLKVRSMRKHPAVSLCVQDPAPPYRYVTVRATAEVQVEPEAARALDERLARHYLGQTGGRYYTETIAPTYPGEPRLVVLTPTHIASMDGSASMNPLALLAMKVVRGVGL
jgi:PPOX class probable F420-dependent enzyme